MAMSKSGRNGISVANPPLTLLTDGDESFSVDAALRQAVGKHILRVEPVKTIDRAAFEKLSHGPRVENEMLIVERLHLSCRHGVIDGSGATADVHGDGPVGGSEETENR